MKVLLDTNVVLSAAWRNSLPERVVLHVATTADVEWVVTEPILREYQEVMQRPRFGLSAAQIENWASLIEMRTLIVPTPVIDISALRDPKDAIFLSAAIATTADYLVTGDSDLLEARISLATPIVTVADFAEIRGIT